MRSKYYISFAIFFAFLLGATHTEAQIWRNSTHSVDVELGGPAIVYSVNYERQFPIRSNLNTSLDVRLGFTYYSKYGRDYGGLSGITFSGGTQNLKLRLGLRYIYLISQYPSFLHPHLWHNLPFEWIFPYLGIKQSLLSGLIYLEAGIIGVFNPHAFPRFPLDSHLGYMSSTTYSPFFKTDQYHKDFIFSPSISLGFNLSSLKKKKE